MNSYFVDLHIHVGMSENGKWIKIPTSRRLTVKNILEEAIQYKGMEIVGIVDALSPLVLEDLTRLQEEGLLRLIGGGGYRYKEQITLILGAEIETSEVSGGMAHTLVYLPDIDSMRQFSYHMSRFIRNINLSSQNAHMPLTELIHIAASFGAVIVPAHVFTPHKSLYGSCCARLPHILGDREIAQISGIELGLSADSLLADRIDELTEFTFLTNSDAHSLEKIAREYNVMLLAEPSFQECVAALSRKNGRAVTANYGLNPCLGKYHRTMCEGCNYILAESAQENVCPKCGSTKIIKGVFDRIQAIADFAEPHHPAHRANYFYQIPLEFIPGLGKKSLNKLMAVFQTEMNIIHQADELQLTSVVGKIMAGEIIKARSGTAIISAGGGGIYGRVLKN